MGLPYVTPKRLDAAVLLVAFGFIAGSLNLVHGHNRTDGLLYRIGVSYVDSVPAPIDLQRSTTLLDAPGEDRELHGVPIYDSVNDIPPYRIQGDDTGLEKCYRGLHQFCLKATICGYVCEQILLAVQSFCEEPVDGKDSGKNCAGSAGARSLCRSQMRQVKWKRCEKARKYNKCFPRICYKKFLVGAPEVDPFNTTTTESRAVQSYVAIVRYKRPRKTHLTGGRQQAIDAIFGEQAQQESRKRKAAS